MYPPHRPLHIPSTLALRIPSGLTLDVEGNKLYWVSRTKTPKVFFCPLSDTNRCEATQYQVQGFSDPFSITIYHKVAYYSSSTKIMRVDLQGKKPVKDLRTDTPHVSALQVYDPSLRNGEFGRSLRMAWTRGVVVEEGGVFFLRRQNRVGEVCLTG